MGISFGCAVDVAAFGIQYDNMIGMADVDVVNQFGQSVFASHCGEVRCLRFESRNMRRGCIDDGLAKGQATFGIGRKPLRKTLR